MAAQLYWAMTSLILYRVGIHQNMELLYNRGCLKLHWLRPCIPWMVLGRTWLLRECGAWIDPLLTAGARTVWVFLTWKELKLSENLLLTISAVQTLELDNQSKTSSDSSKTTLFNSNYESSHTTIRATYLTIVRTVCVCNSCKFKLESSSSSLSP